MNPLSRVSQEIPLSHPSGSSDFRLFPSGKVRGRVGHLSFFFFFAPSTNEHRGRGRALLLLLLLLVFLSFNLGLVDENSEAGASNRSLLSEHDALGHPRIASVGLGKDGSVGEDVHRFLKAGAEQRRKPGRSHPVPTDRTEIAQLGDGLGEEVEMPRVDVGSIEAEDSVHLGGQCRLRRFDAQQPKDLVDVVGSNAVRIDDVQGERSNEVRAFRFDDPSCADRGGVPRRIEDRLVDPLREASRDVGNASDVKLLEQGVPESMHGGALERSSFGDLDLAELAGGDDGSDVDEPNEEGAGLHGVLRGQHLGPLREVVSGGIRHLVHGLDAAREHLSPIEVNDDPVVGRVLERFESHEVGHLENVAGVLLLNSFDRRRNGGAGDQIAQHRVLHAPREPVAESCVAIDWIFQGQSHARSADVPAAVE